MKNTLNYFLTLQFVDNYCVGKDGQRKKKYAQQEGNDKEGVGEEINLFQYQKNDIFYILQNKVSSTDMLIYKIQKNYYLSEN